MKGRVWLRQLGRVLYLGGCAAVACSTKVSVEVVVREGKVVGCARMKEGWKKVS